MKPVYPHLISRCHPSSIREIYHETISTFFSFSHRLILSISEIKSGWEAGIYLKETLQLIQGNASAMFQRRGLKC